MDDDEVKVQNAATIHAAAHKLSVPGAMRIAGFNSEQCANVALQMRVRRRTGKLKESPTPAPVVDCTPSCTSTVSALSSCSKGSRKRRAEWISEMPSGSKRQLESDLAAKPPAKKKEKKSRRTSKQKHEADARQGREKRKKSNATKDATTMYAAEMKKKEQGDKNALSAQQVADVINNKHGTTVTKSTITRYYREGRIGESPKKCGPEGNLPDHVYKVLLTAVGLWMKLHQLEGVKVTNQNALIVALKKAFANTMDFSYNQARDLARRVIRDTAHLLSVGKASKQEARRIMFTTYHNLSMWFDSWENFIVKEGFGRRKTDADIGVEGSLVYYDVDRLINFDETRLSLDSSNGSRGGRPALDFYDPTLPYVGSAGNKTSDDITGIFGTTGGGHPTIPHFQVGKVEGSDEDQKQMRLSNVMVLSMLMLIPWLKR